jgi:hypothetical protein
MLTVGVSAPALADGPGVGTPSIVSLGDSTVSGEAGRWAGNTSTTDSDRVDALGNTAYWNTPTGESLATCHRSKSAEVNIGVDSAGHKVNSLNLACSGSMTTTYDEIPQSSVFKPGLDNFWEASLGDNGMSQPILLADYARTHNVKAIVVRVGANDIGFNNIVATCFKNWFAWSILSMIQAPSLCRTHPTLQASVSAAARAALTQKIVTALGTIRSDMATVGYTKSMYSVIVQTYWSPIPTHTGFRYPEGAMTRQSVGGCGVFDADADWLNNTVLPMLNTALRGAAATFAAKSDSPPVHILDDQYVLNGHRLCENGVNVIENTKNPSTGAPYKTWSDPGAVDQLEWVDQLKTLTTIGLSPYDPKEGAHANYFGQMAERDCLRLAFNYGNPVDATCYSKGFGAPGGTPIGLNQYGEPKMTLGPLAPQAPPQQ